MSRTILHQCGKKDKILNDFFSASSVVSSHGPSAAAKEHEKRILESILPPDLRFLLYAFNFHFHEEKNSLEARLVVMVNVETIHVQASYQRRSQRQHFSVNSGELRISLCDFPWPFQNVCKVC